MKVRSRCRPLRINNSLIFQQGQTIDRSAGRQGSVNRRWGNGTEWQAESG